MAVYPRAGAHRSTRPAGLPRARARGARLLEGPRHLPELGRQRPAPTASSCSTTARRSPTACPTTATCSPATSRTSCRASGRCTGSEVERRFGWDCHGLPAEVEAERLLGISGKDDILAMGIDKFNEACRESVLRYTREWQDYVTRQARWVDFEHDYKTLDLPYMESVMWAFKQLWDKGLIYQGFKVLPYCWRCETPLSNHELRMDDDTYAERTGPVGHGPVQAGDRRVAAGLDHHAVDAAVQPGRARSARTSATWCRRKDGERYILAQDRLAAYEQELEDADRRRRADRAPSWPGRRYEPLFALPGRRREFGTADAFRVIAVRRRDHRGRHRRGAHGPRLRRGRRLACTAAGIPTVLTVDEQGRFTAVVTDFGRPARLRGEHADHRAAARRRARWCARETYTHSYPHCWRCRNPLIYKAVSSWFVEVTRFSGPDGRAERGDHLGARARQARPVRQVAGERAGLVDQPEPVLGLARSRSGRATTRTTRGPTCTGRWTSSSGTSACARPTCTGPAIDELTRPNPDDPTGRVRDAPGTRGA